MSNYADKSPTLWPGVAPKETGEASGPERRISQRFPFTAAAEVIDVRSKARVTGRSSDLGLGGCYVDTLAPLAVGATVQVRLERGNREMEATGVVTYALVSMGMGLSFTEIKPEHQAVLKAWIAELSGEAPVMPDAIAPASERGTQAAAENDIETDPEEGLPASAASNRQMLNELINLMVRKKLISDNEAAALLRQMYR
jgi:hypothetical protein